MRKMILMLAACSLAACTNPAAPDLGVADPPAPVEQVSEQVIVRGTQGLIVANNIYQAVAKAAEVATPRLSTPTLLRLKDLNDRALVVLQGADTALSEAERAAEILEIAGEIAGLIGGG